MKKIAPILVLVAGLLTLSACTASKSSQSTSSQSKTKLVTKSSSSSQEKTSLQTKQKAAVQSSSQSTETSPWSQQKSEQLATFMKQWGKKMNQSYVAYTPGHNVNFYGIHEPDDLTTMPPAVNEQKVAIKWSNDGKVDAGVYALVAVYSDAEIAAYADQHLYFFTIYNKQPVVLITMQNQGNENNWLYFTKTQNRDVADGFAKIVNQ